LCPLPSELSINHRFGPLNGHADQARFHPTLDFFVANLKPEAIQARDFGGLDRKGYSLMNQASLRSHAEDLPRFGKVGKLDWRFKSEPGVSGKRDTHSGNLCSINGRQPWRVTVTPNCEAQHCKGFRSKPS
jgi:hypothetical protein